MAITKLNDNLNVHQSLPDKPTLSAEDLKAKFDEPVDLIKTYVNETLTVELDTALSTKVDKITGKSLSTNDYTTAEKSKLANIADNATKVIVTVGTGIPTGRF